MYGWFSIKKYFWQLTILIKALTRARERGRERERKGKREREKERESDSEIKLERREREREIVWALISFRIFSKFNCQRRSYQICDVTWNGLRDSSKVC